MATVIDSLLIKLSLDPSDYSKSTAEVVKATKDTTEVVKKSSDAMASSFRKVATEVIGLFVAVRSVEDVIGFFGRLNASTRQLGYDSKNIGIAATELRNLQFATELAGGTAAGVTQTIQNLNQALFAKHYKGEVSDQLIFLQRLGVQYEGTGGKLRDFNSILLQTASIIERNGRSRQENVQYLQAIGFDPGSINRILSGSKALKESIAEQERLPPLTDAQVAANTRLAVAWEQLKQRIQVASESLLTTAEPAINSLFALFKEGIVWVNAHQEDISRWLTNTINFFKDETNTSQIKKFFTDLAFVVGETAKAIKYLFDLLHGSDTKIPLVEGVEKALNAGSQFESGAFRAVTGTQADLYRPALQAAEKKYGIPSGLLTRVAQQESGFRADVITGLTRSDKGAVGLMQLLPKYFPNAGKDPDQDIDSAAQELSILYKRFGNWEAAVAAYNAGSGRVTKFLNGQATLPTETQKYLKNVFGGGASQQSLKPPPTPSTLSSGPPLSSRGGPSNQLEIGSMSIYTQATDADGIMVAARRAVERKLMVSQAEPGLA